MKTSVSPNFIIAGVARSGTTSLYHYLKQHSEIGFPGKKEPKYFSSLQSEFPHNGPGDRHVDGEMIQSWNDYIKLFENLDAFSKVGEASSDYFYFHEHTAEAIKEILGDILIIIVLRNPTERAYSAYNNLVRDGRETLEFMEALRQEEERIAQNWDWMWAYKHGGLYAEALEHYKAVFSNVKVILFDDLERNPQSIVKEIFCFLGVAEDPKINVETKYSHSGKPKNGLIAKLTDRNSPLAFKLRKMIMGIVPRAVLEKIADKLLTKESIPIEAKRYLANYFREDIEKLEKMLNRDLGAWK